MPKQRNPYLFNNNSNEVTRSRQLDMDISNMERAPIYVPTIRSKIDIKRPRKPFNPMIPVYGPTGSPTAFPIIFMINDAGSGSLNHYFYQLNSDNTITLLSTQSWVAGYWYGHTLKRLGNSYYLSFVSDIGAGQVATIYRSRDRCSTWELVKYVWRAPHAFCMDAGGRIWLGGYDADDFGATHMKMWYSDDDGDSWILQGEIFSAGGGMDMFSMDAHPTDQNVIVCTGWHWNGTSYGVLRTEDRGENWSASPISNFESQYSSFEVKNSMFLSDGRFVIMDADLNGGAPYPVQAYVSDSNGVSFSGPYVVQADNSGESGSDYFNPVMGLHGEGDKLFACFGETHEGGGPPGPEGNKANSGKIYQSLDRGESWSEVTHWPATLRWEDINSIFYDADNDRLILITTGAFSPDSDDDARVFVSSPPGENWQIVLTGDYNQLGSALMTIVR